MLLASKAGVPAETVARSMVFEALYSYSIIAFIGLALLLAAKVHLWVGLAVLALSLFTMALVSR